MDVIIGRMIRAARLESQLYEEVEHDVNATQQAAIVVGIVAICSLIGGVLAFILGAGIAAAVGQPASTAGLGQLIIWGLIGPFITWIIFSYVAFFVGTRMFAGTATPGELLRCLGFAQSPGVLAILAFIPCLNIILAIVLLVWSVCAGVIAIRQALDITTQNAIITGVISFVILIVIQIVIRGILGI